MSSQTITQQDQIALNQIFESIESKTVLETFTPNSGGQEKIVELPPKYKELIIGGGNSSGKSYISVVRAGFHTIPEKDEEGKPTGKTIDPHKTLHIPPTGIEGWFSTYSQDNQRDNLRPIFDKLLGPYVKEYDMREGIIHRAMFENPHNAARPSWINFKWITQGFQAYTGPKKHWIALDEPHPRAIYRECQWRLTKGGYMWTALTPVVDPESPQVTQWVQWMADEIVEPWERDPKRFPRRMVIHMDVEENAAHLDMEQVNHNLSDLSPVERLIRKTGMFLIYGGRSAFERDMIMTMRTHLQEHIEEATPEYGIMIYDEKEPPGKQARFIADPGIDFFPDKPSGEYIVKVWERPVPVDGLQSCPGYAIAVDVAEGKPGGDFTNAYVFRKDNRRIVAALHGHISEAPLAQNLWLLGHWYNDGKPGYRPAWLAIETRGPGALPMTYLLRGYQELHVKKYPIGRIFHRPTAENLQKGIRAGILPGWDTTIKTRNYVVGGARRGLVESYHEIQSGYRPKIPDMGCLNEALGFVQNKQGKYEGHPDDRIMSLGIGNQVMDLLYKGEGVVDAKHEDEDEESLWGFGRDANGQLAPMMNQAFIQKILNQKNTRESNLIY